MSIATEAYRARPYAGDADLAAVAELLNTCSAADDLNDTYSIDDLRLEFADPDLDAAKNLRLWESEHGELVAFGDLWIDRHADHIEGSLYWRVQPAARDASLPRAIFAWAEARLRDEAGDSGRPLGLASAANEQFGYARAALERNGMDVVRHYYEMTRPLSKPVPAAALPDGFALRHVASDADVVAWVEAYNLSFIDHYNFHPRSEERQRHWLQHPAYRAERDLIATAPDGTIAAFCTCMIDPAENQRNERNDGWIDILGTRRGFRKLGLGRAMLLSGMQVLRDAGAENARLRVDASNPTGALRLYESVGFAVVQAMVRYRKTFGTL